MSALEVIQSTMIDTVQGPLGNGTGATSVGDPTAGTGKQDIYNPMAITTADRVGAGILTALVLGTLTGGCYWMSI